MQDENQRSGLNSFAPENVQSDAIVAEHMNAVAFVWEIVDRNGGSLPDYDSSTWTLEQYANALGRTLTEEETASVRALHDAPATFRVPRERVGQPLALQAKGTSVLDVRGCRPDFTLAYGVDREMAIVGSLLTPVESPSYRDFRSEP